MSYIENVSSSLGEYMLRGWVLTDHSCPNAGCAIPMLRSPNGKSPVVEFCVNCSKISDNTKPASNHQIEPNAYVSSGSSMSETSRTSTPPTEFSDATSLQEFAPPPETDQSRRRREQSDRAASEIGKRLLKGWAMLADECPNPDCYGVPLVRPPNVGGEKDSRKECVICGNIYLTEVDWAGQERLVPESTRIAHPTGDKESAISSRTGADASTTVFPAQTTTTPTDSRPVGRTKAAAPPPMPPTSRFGLDESANALQTCLSALSTKMNSLSSAGAVDTIGIINAADAISKVTQALTHVRQLQWSEAHANTNQ